LQNENKIRAKQNELEENVKRLGECATCRGGDERKSCGSTKDPPMLDASKRSS